MLDRIVAAGVRVRDISLGLHTLAHDRLGPLIEGEGIFAEIRIHVPGEDSAFRQRLAK